MGRAGFSRAGLVAVPPGSTKAATDSLVPWRAHRGLHSLFLTAHSLQHTPRPPPPSPDTAMAPKAEKKPAKKVAVKKAGAGGKPKRAASKSETYKVRPQSQQLQGGRMSFS